MAYALRIVILRYEQQVKEAVKDSAVKKQFNSMIRGSDSEETYMMKFPANLQCDCVCHGE